MALTPLSPSYPPPPPDPLGGAGVGCPHVRPHVQQAAPLRRQHAVRLAAARHAALAVRGALRHPARGGAAVGALLAVRLPLLPL